MFLFLLYFCFDLHQEIIAGFPDVTSLRPTGGPYIFGDQRFMSFQRGQLNWVNSYYLWEHIQQADLILKIAIMADHITRTVRYGRNQPT